MTDARGDDAWWLMKTAEVLRAAALRLPDGRWTDRLLVMELEVRAARIDSGIALARALGHADALAILERLNAGDESE